MVAVSTRLTLFLHQKSFRPLNLHISIVSNIVSFRSILSYLSAFSICLVSWIAPLPLLGDRSTAAIGEISRQLRFSRPLLRPRLFLKARPKAKRILLLRRLQIPTLAPCRPLYGPNLPRTKVNIRLLQDLLQRFL